MHVSYQSVEWFTKRRVHSAKTVIRHRKEKQVELSHAGEVVVELCWTQITSFQNLTPKCEYGTIAVKCYRTV